MDKLLKSLIKVGLAAAAPVWGNIVGMAMNEAVDLLFGAHSERLAKDLEGKMLQRMKQQARRELHFAPERLAYIVPNTETILTRYALSQHEWSTANYSATKAARIIVQRADSLLRTLDSDSEAASNA